MVLTYLSGIMMALAKHQRTYCVNLNMATF